MTLDEIIVRHQIDINTNYKELCIEGINRMKNSIDINHDVEHIYEIFELLNKFLDKEISIKKSDIDFEVLLTSICWHDVWLAKKGQSKRLRNVIADRTYEGVGSARMFREFISREKISIDKIWEITWIVSLHADFRFLPIIKVIKKYSRNLELKILSDLDTLSMFSPERIKRTVKKYAVKGKTDPLLFRIGFFYVTKMMIKKNSNILHFEYTKKLYKKKKKKVYKLLLDIGKEFLDNKEYYFDKSDPNYNFIRNFNPDLKKFRKEIDS